MNINPQQAGAAPNKMLFLACFMSIVTTSFSFVLRALTLPQWEAEFNLIKTQVGEISRVGLWLFAISNLKQYDAKNNTALHSTYVTQEKKSIFGDYQSVNLAKLAEAPEDEKQSVIAVQDDAKKDALKTVALFPIGMLICYLLLSLYFRSKGGYKVVILSEDNLVKA